MLVPSYWTQSVELRCGAAVADCETAGVDAPALLSDDDNAETVVQTAIWPTANPGRTMATVAILDRLRSRRARTPSTIAAMPSGRPIQNPPPGRSKAMVDPGTDKMPSARARPGREDRGRTSTAGRVAEVCIAAPFGNRLTIRPCQRAEARTSR